MPELITNGEHLHDHLSVMAVMLWPNEDQHVIRNQFYAASIANEMLKSGQSSYRMEAGHLSAILDAPGWSELGNQIAQQTKRATIAGYVFAFVYLMDKYSHLLPPRGDQGGNLDKAYSLAVAWAKTGVTHGDGSPLYANETSVKSCWRVFRPVAHFWAAMELNKGTHAVPSQSLFSSDWLPTYLASVSYLQCYGLQKAMTNKSKGASPYLLGKETAWLIDAEAHQPRDSFPVDEGLVADAPWLKFLRDYASG
jgi:hypothetical protein